MSPIAAVRLLGPIALAERLLAGDAAIFPTDTLPALGAIPVRAGILWELKRRPAVKPLILMGADLNQLLSALGMPWRSEWLAAAAAGWPGAITLVLPAQGPILEALNPGGSSLGLRVPACPLACQLLKHSGPLATTSANPSGAPAATSAAAAATLFSQLALLAPLPWQKPLGQASTVVAWREQGEARGWQLLRAGAVLPPRI